MKSLIEQIEGLKKPVRLTHAIDGDTHQRIVNEYIDKALTLIKQARAELKRRLVIAEIGEGLYDETVCAGDIDEIIGKE